MLLLVRPLRVSAVRSGYRLPLRTQHLPCRWKLAPRVALLACTVWAEMVTISQLLSSSKAGPSQATVALSAILIVGILLLVVLLPVAFFRAKLQDAREQVQFRKVFALLASSMGDHMSPAPYRWRSPSRKTWHCNKKKCPRFDHVCYPMRTLVH